MQQYRIEEFDDHLVIIKNNQLEMSSLTICLLVCVLVVIVGVYYKYKQTPLP